MFSDSPIFKYKEVVFVGESAEFLCDLGAEILQDVYMCLQYTDVRTNRVSQLKIKIFRTRCLKEYSFQWCVFSFSKRNQLEL